jgi:hypothetical protein
VRRLEKIELNQEKKNHIDEITKKVLTEVFGKEIVLPIDIIKIVKKYGFTLVNARLDENEDGFIMINKSENNILGFETNKLIGVNSSKSLPWKRFIIAHELGHYKLEYEDSNNKLQFAHRDHRKGKDERENEIDYFSASILMPKEEFINLHEYYLSNPKVNKDLLVDFLATQFQVTKKMVTRRIEEVGLSIG